MQNRHFTLLLVTAASFLTTGCSNNNQTPTKKDDFFCDNGGMRTFKQEEEFYQKHPELLPGGGEIITYNENLAITAETKSLINDIWTKLTAEGFSGYDPTRLDRERYSGDAYADFNPCASRRSDKDAKDFQIRFLDLMLNEGHWRYAFGYVDTLEGLTYRHNGTNKTLLIATEKAGASSKNRLVFATADRAGYRTTLANDDEIVSQALIDKWNQLFYDTIQSHLVFKDEIDPAKVLEGGTATQGHLFTKATPTGIDTSELTLSGAQGSFLPLSLPIQLKITGNLTEHFKTANTQTAVQYMFGDIAFGATHTYANMGDGFHSENSFRSEATLFSTYYLKNWFATAHLGGIIAHTHNHHWNATTSALTFGYENVNGISPFVELQNTYLNNYAQTVGFVGMHLDITKHATDSYTVSTKLKAAAGYNWNTQSMVPNLECTGQLQLNNGIAFNAALTLSSTVPSTVSTSFTLER